MYSLYLSVIVVFENVQDRMTDSVLQVCATAFLSRLFYHMLWSTSNEGQGRLPDSAKISHMISATTGDNKGIWLLVSSGSSIQHVNGFLK